MAKEFCQNRSFETKLISNLPHEYSFANGSKSLIVDYTTTDQFDRCRRMIEEAALRGDNVGLDEYDKESIEMMFRISEIFQASDPDTGNIEAFMIIHACLYQRSYDSCTASVYVFRSEDVDDEVYADLMSLVAEFAKDIDIGFTQCFTQLALCLQGLYLQLRRRGFITVAVLPKWVNIAGFNLSDNAILVKDFGMPGRPMRSSEQLTRVLELHYPPARVFDEYTSVDIPTIPGLPKTFLLENGTKLVLRNVRKDDDHLLYKIFSDAEKKGEGYSVHEFPSLNIMRIDMLADGYTAVVEEAATNKLLGFLIYSDSAMSRRGTGIVCDGSAIVIEGLRGKGLGKPFRDLARFMRTGLGYEKVLRETFFNNSRALNVFNDDDDYYSQCGVLPRGGFQKGVGWVDLIIHVHDVDQKPNNHLEETIKCRL